MVDYKVRGIHWAVCKKTCLEFQVITYGVPDPYKPDGEDRHIPLQRRLEERGFDPFINTNESRYVTERYDFGKGRTPQTREEHYRQHFFSPRI